MRAVIVIALAVLGFFVGTLVGALVTAIPPGWGAFGGLLAGIVGGVLLARQTPTRHERTERLHHREWR